MMVRQIDTTIRHDAENERRLVAVLMEIGARTLLPLKRQKDGMGIWIRYKGKEQAYHSVQLMVAALAVRTLQRTAISALQKYTERGHATADEIEALEVEVQNTRDQAASLVCDRLEALEAGK